VGAITAAEPPVLYGAFIGLKSIPAVGFQAAVQAAVQLAGHGKTGWT